MLKIGELYRFGKSTKPKNLRYERGVLRSIHPLTVVQTEDGAEHTIRRWDPTTLYLGTAPEGWGTKPAAEPAPAVVEPQAEAPPELPPGSFPLDAQDDTSPLVVRDDTGRLRLVQDREPVSAIEDVTVIVDLSSKESELFEILLRHPDGISSRELGHQLVPMLAPDGVRKLLKKLGDSGLMRYEGNTRNRLYYPTDLALSWHRRRSARIESKATARRVASNPPATVEPDLVKTETLGAVRPDGLDRLLDRLEATMREVQRLQRRLADDPMGADEIAFRAAVSERDQIAKEIAALYMRAVAARLKAA